MSSAIKFVSVPAGLLALSLTFFSLQADFGFVTSGTASVGTVRADTNWTTKTAADTNW
jgi:hypothetical protein